MDSIRRISPVDLATIGSSTNDNHTTPTNANNASMYSLVLHPPSTSLKPSPMQIDANISRPPMPIPLTPTLTGGIGILTPSYLSSPVGGSVSGGLTGGSGLMTPLAAGGPGWSIGWPAAPPSTSTNTSLMMSPLASPSVSSHPFIESSFLIPADSPTVVPSCSVPVVGMTEIDAANSTTIAIGKISPTIAISATDVEAFLPTPSPQATTNSTDAGASTNTTSSPNSTTPAASNDGSTLTSDSSRTCGVKRDHDSISHASSLLSSPSPRSLTCLDDLDHESHPSTRSSFKKARLLDQTIPPRSDPTTTRTIQQRRHMMSGMISSIPSDLLSPSSSTSTVSVSPLLHSFSKLSHHRRGSSSHQDRADSPTSQVSEDIGVLSPVSATSTSSISRRKKFARSSRNSQTSTPTTLQSTSSVTTTAASTPQIASPPTSTGPRKRTLKRHASLDGVSNVPPFYIPGCEPLPLPKESDGRITGEGNGVAAGVTVPKPTPGKRGGAFSCHSCKSTKKNINELFFCTNILPKNSQSPISVEAAKQATEAQLRTRATSLTAHELKSDDPNSSTLKYCRKKYCLSCLQRLYPREILVLRGPHYDQWTCPSCFNRCSCAGCERRVAGEAEAPWRRKKKDAKRALMNEKLAHAAESSAITPTRKRASSSTKARSKRTKKLSLDITASPMTITTRMKSRTRQDETDEHEDGDEDERMKSFDDRGEVLRPRRALSADFGAKFSEHDNGPDEDEPEGEGEDDERHQDEDEDENENDEEGDDELVNIDDDDDEDFVPTVSSLHRPSARSMILPSPQTGPIPAPLPSPPSQPFDTFMTISPSLNQFQVPITPNIGTIDTNFLFPTSSPTTNTTPTSTTTMTTVTMSAITPNMQSKSHSPQTVQSTFVQQQHQHHHHQQQQQSSTLMLPNRQTVLLSPNSMPVSPNPPRSNIPMTPYSMETDPSLHALDSTRPMNMAYQSMPSLKDDSFRFGVDGKFQSVVSSSHSADPRQLEAILREKQQRLAEQQQLTEFLLQQIHSQKRRHTNLHITKMQQQEAQQLHQHQQQQLQQQQLVHQQQQQQLHHHHHQQQQLQRRLPSYPLMSQPSHPLPPSHQPMHLRIPTQTLSHHESPRSPSMFTPTHDSHYQQFAGSTLNSPVHYTNSNPNMNSSSQTSSYVPNEYNYAHAPLKSPINPPVSHHTHNYPIHHIIQPQA